MGSILSLSVGRSLAVAECSRSAPKFVMLPHLLTNARPLGGIRDVDRYRSDFAFGSPNNPAQAYSAAAARPGYEASPAERGNEEAVVRQGEVDNSSPFAKVLHLKKSRGLQLHIYVMRSSERPR
jgi:hypothetical protein